MKDKKILLLSILILAVPAVAADFYNASNLTASTDLYMQAVALNSIVDGLLGFMIMAIAIVITFTVVAQKSDAIAALGAASFIGIVTVAIELPLQLISFEYFFDISIILGIAVVLSIFMKNQ